MNSSRMRGLTLIELMIVVAVVAILAAVAYPSYTSALVKNRRANAQIFLSDVSQRQQQYLADHRAYASTLTQLNVTVPTDVSDYYSVSLAEITTTTPRSYKVTATPIAGKSQASDGALSIAGDGTKEGKW